MPVSVFGVEPDKGHARTISGSEGKNKVGISMTTYLEDSYGGFSLEEWLKLDGKTYPIGTPIWSDWGNQIDILINPKQGK